MYIEAKGYSIPKEQSASQPHFKVTGNLGDIMNETVEIARTFANNFLLEHFHNHDSADYLSTHYIHLHCPEGATFKARA